MILTEKAKEDFLKWAYSEYDLKLCEILNMYPYTIQNALIIEFFDSVGIYIVIDYYGKGVYTFHVYNEKGNDFVNIYRNYLSSLQEATKQAIIKANEIYNEKNK